MGDLGGIAVVGVPLHRSSLTPGRCDLAPAAIREALHRFSTWDPETQVDLPSGGASDYGDLAVAEREPAEVVEEVSGAVAGLVRDNAAAVLLGGDNSVTRPGVLGVASSFIEMGQPSGDIRAVGVLTLDAHHDLRGTSDGLTNGNPIRALLEEGVPGENVIQVGIQPFANSRAYSEVARDAGITVVTAQEVRARGVASVVQDSLDVLASRVESIYVDLDVDVLDRAYAPACPGSRPGGLTPMEIQEAMRICGAHSHVRALDIVEVDPTKDVAEITVLAAASFLLSFAVGIASRSSKEDT